MAYLKIKNVAQPIPTEIDWNALIKYVISAIAFLTAFFKFSSDYFKNKAKEKEEFIAKVASAAVKAAMGEALKGIREDIDTLFKYREEDRRHIDSKFDTIMLEMRK